MAILIGTEKICDDRKAFSATYRMLLLLMMMMCGWACSCMRWCCVRMMGKTLTYDDSRMHVVVGHFVSVIVVGIDAIAVGEEGRIRGCVLEMSRG